MEEIPRDIVVYLFSFLDGRSTLSCFLSCKSWCIWIRGSQSLRDNVLRYLCGTLCTKCQNGRFMSQSVQRAHYRSLFTNRIEEPRVSNLSSFEELGLSSELLRGLFAVGIVQPNTLQRALLSNFQEDRDLIVEAFSGSCRKSSLILLALHTRRFKSFFLFPARELTVQAAHMMFGQEVKVGLIVGGVSNETTAKNLHSDTQLFFGTPGISLSMIEAGLFSVSDMKMIVLCEFDRMLDLGFRESLLEILKRRSPTCQLVVMSCNLSSRGVSQFCDENLHFPYVYRE